MHLRNHIIAAGSSALILLVSLILSPSPSEAARVTKVKDKQILIETESSDIVEGEKYFIIIDGKKKGVVLINKVKNGKALGKLTKGKAEVDASVEPTGRSAKSANASDGSDDEILKKKSKRGKSHGDSGSGSEGGHGPTTIVGVIAGYAMNSQNVTFSNGTSLAMTGSGYSLKGFGDIPLSGSLGLLARTGIEQFNVASGKSSTAIMYATADALLRYSFGETGFVPWIAGGMGIHFPVSKTSTDALDISGISSSTVFFGTLGFTWSLSETSYLLGMFEYGMFPPSNSVTTNLMTARFGYGWNW
jgi:hypothetical protein